jgi:hypothetical protein
MHRGFLRCFVGRVPRAHSPPRASISARLVARIDLLILRRALTAALVTCVAGAALAPSAVRADHEVLEGEYRAVTLEANEHRVFAVADLEKVTGSTGRCIDEGNAVGVENSFWVEATCSGLRTVMVWKKNGQRMHLMVCAEGENASPERLALRKKLQAELKSYKSLTPCVRNGKVELWGWVATESDRRKLAALETKHGAASVRNFVELIERQP